MPSVFRRIPSVEYLFFIEFLMFFGRIPSVLAGYPQLPNTLEGIRRTRFFETEGIRLDISGRIPSVCSRIPSVSAGYTQFGWIPSLLRLFGGSRTPRRIPSVQKKSKKISFFAKMTNSVMLLPSIFHYPVVESLVL